MTLIHYLNYKQYLIRFIQTPSPMAPNLKVNILALHDHESTIDAASLKPAGPPSSEHAAGDSESYWDWSADVPAEKERKPCTLDDTVNGDSYWAERNYDEDIDSRFFIDYSREKGCGNQKGTVVRKAIERKTGQRFAVKSFSRRKCQEEEVKHEAAMLLSCDHPNVLKFHGIHQDHKSFHLVMEYASGGELYDCVIKRAKKQLPHNRPVFSEPEAACILQQILSAMAHCHSAGLVHRDLKLENLVFTDKKKHNLQIKVIDFGLAARLPRNGQLLTDRVGTNYYVAPELLNSSGYNQAVDVWALGVVAYTLFSAKPPFRGATEEETYALIQSQPVQFARDAVWQQVSAPAKAFLQACLQKDPKLRPSARDLLQDDWLQQQSAQLESSTTSNKRFLHKFKQALHLS
uniref:Protein kinase domain-containing protein n=1 Tax=Helicotheca tamesis TaxID=374047 RepID=A0A7S2H128_9STRA|mmetsp:Transcript_14221/g.19451  ORF Transcript_14221/g.19451 Transcript_14221/m.19451 type:complete len:404 (+) Transcript_14221:84-1295(+)|eukprot:CAMPEP_0185725106 /NCGR_PEP_ID=MMETSP1171-20130828/1428_1 /TAXON_ID=374046 /ORGANISM="Helicotheca tamensis, Strain CCMP826" /LENGTH=403 /DNA_ID=CAMNT_0028393139 /DNA_START=60 /DNA_END=1271 /DNA_ORIENTATION=+